MVYFRGKNQTRKCTLIPKLIKVFGDILVFELYKPLTPTPALKECIVF